MALTKARALIDWESIWHEHELWKEWRAPPSLKVHLAREGPWCHGFDCDRTADEDIRPVLCRSNDIGDSAMIRLVSITSCSTT